MTAELVDMTITEISVVDDPAAPDAVISIFKAKGGKPEGDTEDKADGADDEEAEGEGKKGKKKMPFNVTKIATSILEAIEDASGDIVAKALSEGYSDDPDAAAAAAAIFQEIVMGGEAVAKTLDQANEKIVALTKQLADKDVLLVAEIAKNKAPDTGEVTEEVLKSLPAGVRKALEDGKTAAADLAKSRDEAELKESVSKARDLKMADPDKTGAALLRVRKGKSTAEDADLLEALFRAAAAQATTGALFKALGTSDDKSISDDPEAFLKAKAEEIRKVNTGMTYEAAYTKAMAENPKVYDDYISKRRASAAA
jgi:hypothetical protein